MASRCPRPGSVEVHPYFTQQATREFNAAHCVLTQAWSPIGGITVYRGDAQRSTLTDPVILRIAEAHGKSAAQVMLRWHLQQLRSAIPKSVRPERIAAVGGIQLPLDLFRPEGPALDLAAVRRILPAVEAAARGLYASGRNTVKHNRGTHVFAAGNIRFGLEMRRLPIGDGGLAVHVLADIGGAPGKAYTEETELLAFDCFWNGPHYHYGPRNKNHRIYWDTTLVENPLEWVFAQLESGKLPAMIRRAGYPGIAADLDADKIASVLPALRKQAHETWAAGERSTGHPGLPLEVTPNLAAD